MKTAQLSGSLRANVGKKAAKAIRLQDKVPCVLYGGEDQIFFQTREVDVRKIIFSPDVYRIELDIDGTMKTAVVQDLQKHPVTDKIVHIDFFELNENKPVKIAIPIKITGRARGVVAGGRLMTVFRKVRVKGLPKDIPAEVEIDVTPLRVGQDIRISKISIPGVTVLEDEKAVIVAVKRSRTTVAEVDDDEDASSEETPTAEETKEN